VVAITVLRDVSVYAGALAVEYATSDLTARGIDSEHFEACLMTPIAARPDAHCGDYEQTSGVLVIAAGDTSGGFYVRIMDDLCYERRLEYIQVRRALHFSCPRAALCATVFILLVLGFFVKFA
jgi:hypothetical protein